MADDPQARARRIRLIAIWLHAAGLACILTLGLLLWGTAFFTDNRDRLDDLRGFYWLIAPALALAAINMVLGIRLALKETPVVARFHHTTAIVTLVLFGGSLLLGNLLAIPVLASVWMALDRKARWKPRASIDPMNLLGA